MRAAALALLVAACGTPEAPPPDSCAGSPDPLCRFANLGVLPYATLVRAGAPGYFEFPAKAGQTITVSVKGLASPWLLGPDRRLLALPRSSGAGEAVSATANETATYFVKLEPGGETPTSSVDVYGDVFAPLEAALPPSVQDCATGCASPASATVCFEGAACTPNRTTTVAFHLNGRPFGAMAMRIQSEAGVPQIQASGASWVFSNFLMTNGASTVTLAAADDLQLTYMNLAPVWGGTTNVDIVATGSSAGLGDAFFYRFDGYDPVVAPGFLFADLEEIAGKETQLTGITTPRYRAWLLPTELAILGGGEGNWSFGDGSVTINYGNPDWTATQGGVEAVVKHEFAHEFTHTMFAQVVSHFRGNPACLNEGLADAVGALAGYVPLDDFGTAQDGSDFTKGCRDSTEMHAKGNCVLWNAWKSGLVTKANVGALFHPAADVDFDSCDLASRRTGNGYLVYLSDALATDATAFVTSIGLENAGSLAAARAELSP